MEFKNLALKLEQNQTPKKKTKKSKAASQLKTARVKDLPEDDESRFATFPNILALTSSDLDLKVANLNKSLSADHSLHLLPSHVRMDLSVDEPVLLSQETENLASLVKMERELHKGDSRCFLDRKAAYLAAASKNTPYFSPSTAAEVAALTLKSVNLEPGSSVPLSAPSSRRLEMDALIGTSPITVLLDTGAQGMFMGLRMAKRLGLESKPVSQIQKVAYGKEHSQDTLTEYVTTRVGRTSIFT